MKTRYKIQTQKGSSKSQSNINYESIVHTLTKIILKIHHLLHFQVTSEIGQGHKDILEQKNYKCYWICSPTLFSSKMKVYHEWQLRLSLKHWWLRLHPNMTLTAASHAKVNPSGSSLTIKYCLWQKPPPPPQSLSKPLSWSDTIPFMLPTNELFPRPYDIVWCSWQSVSRLSVTKHHGTLCSNLNFLRMLWTSKTGERNLCFWLAHSCCEPTLKELYHQRKIPWERKKKKKKDLKQSWLLAFWSKKNQR